MKKIVIIILFSLFPFFALAEPNPGITPQNGYVPDKETAIAIAVAIWTPLYGKENIEKQKPYIATLDGDVWQVKGSMAKLTPGGVAMITINKKDGKIIYAVHTK